MLSSPPAASCALRNAVELSEQIVRCRFVVVAIDCRLCRIDGPSEDRATGRAQCHDELLSQMPDAAENRPWCATVGATVGTTYYYGDLVGAGGSLQLSRDWNRTPLTGHFVNFVMFAFAMFAFASRARERFARIGRLAHQLLEHDARLAGEALVRLSTEAAPATGLAAADGDGEVFDADVASFASFAAADPGAGVVRLRVRYQPLDAAALSARAAKDAAEEPREPLDETTKRTKDASLSGRGSGAFPRSLSAASRSVIDGAYASGEFISRSMGGSGDREDALETARALLRERDREVAEMRVEKAALERKLRAEGGRKGIRAEEDEKESGKPFPREGRSSGSYSPGATKKNAAVSRPSARVTAVNADADAAAEREPAERSAVAADPRLAADPRIDRGLAIADRLTQTRAARLSAEALSLLRTRMNNIE